MIEIRNNNTTETQAHLKKHFCLFSKGKVHFRKQFSGMI